jgi:hypothetical protein
MFLRTVAALLLTSSAAFSALKAVHVTERSDVLAGKPFGKSGPYERIVAKVHFAVDPANPANRSIADIDLAPRNAAGLVEFSADLYVLKPRDPATGNGTVLFEVSNRGRKGMLGTFHRAARSALDPREERDFGDGFLLERGFTLVWLGWQFDVPEQPELIRLFTPVARQDGVAITGRVRSEFVPDAKVSEFSLGDRTMIPYRAADPREATAQLTVRDRCNAARTPVPRSAWRFSEDGAKIQMTAGFEPGKIYEVVYTAENPPLVGLGPAAVRDLISYIKYAGPAASINVLGDHRRFIRNALGFGTSQSGRFLRTFLYYGFNRDEQNRKVFDGVWAHVAGAGRGSFNHRFAQPSRDGHPHLNCLYPTDIFPFTDAAQTDPETGLSGGILERATSDKVTPRVFYTNGSYEYWGRSAALIHSSLDGRQDIASEPGTRIYFLTGTQHGAGNFPPDQTKGTAHLANGNDYRWHMRALMSAMQAWLAENKEPPASQMPLAAKDQLVAPGALAWPKIPSSRVPARPQRAYRADYGPEFRSKGLVSQEPPKVGSAFAVVVPQVDTDGNETSGIRAPMIQVPLATYTGWNLRDPSIGASEELYSMVGSTFYLPRTKAEREKTRDPRPSLEERYKGREDYLARYETAARELVRGGYLLEADLPTLLAAGAAQWDAVMKR